jgi:hypothetical protein
VAVLWVRMHHVGEHGGRVLSPEIDNLLENLLGLVLQVSIAMTVTSWSTNASTDIDWGRKDNVAQSTCEPEWKAALEVGRSLNLCLLML